MSTNKNFIWRVYVNKFDFIFLLYQDVNKQKLCLESLCKRIWFHFSSLSGWQQTKTLFGKFMQTNLISFFFFIRMATNKKFIWWVYVNKFDFIFLLYHDGNNQKLHLMSLCKQIWFHFSSLSGWQQTQTIWWVYVNKFDFIFLLYQDVNKQKLHLMSLCKQIWFHFSSLSGWQQTKTSFGEFM